MSKQIQKSVLPGQKKNGLFTRIKKSLAFYIFRAFSGGNYTCIDSFPRKITQNSTQIIDRKMMKRKEK